ncbi:MAG: hypothetical protein WED00_05130 [Aquisalimonadaceae bacterium]
MSANLPDINDEIARIREKNPGLSENKIEILEVRKKFSDCILWKMIEDFYKQAGPKAWEAIPYYATSNPSIAETYASCIIAYLLDIAPSLGKHTPVYIVELGAGQSLFCYYLLKELVEKRESFECLRGIQVRYVATDFADNNVESWERCKELQPFLTSGLLDFAVFDPEKDSMLQLKRSGESLVPGSSNCHIIATANYFFDTIRQDFFHVDNGVLREGRVTFYREASNPGVAPRFDEVRKIDSYIDVNPDYYNNPNFNAILDSYLKDVDQASILFPVGALKCIEKLEAISGGNFALLVSDKGFCNKNNLLGLREVSFEPMHECTSFMVNFDALARYFELRGGYAFIPSESNALNTGMYISPQNPARKFEHTRYFANSTLMKKVSVHALANMPILARRANLDDANAELKFRVCMSVMQLSNYDPMTFAACGAILSEIYSELRPDQKRQLKFALFCVEANFHPRVPGIEFAANWARALYSAMGMYDACLSNARQALDRNEDNGHALYYMGTCLEYKGQRKAALDCFKKAGTLAEPTTQ